MHSINKIKWEIIYLCGTILNCTLSFLRFLILFGRTLTIFTDELETHLWKHDRLATSEYDRLLILVSNPGTDKLVWKFFWLSTTNTIKDNIYWHDTGKMSSFLNIFLHELLAPTSYIILIILFCNVDTQNILVEFPEKIIPYFITEWKYAKHNTLRTSILSLWNNPLTVKHAVLNLGRIWSIHFFQFRWLSIGIPKNFVLNVPSMSLFAYSIANWASNTFFGVNFTISVFSISKTSWLAWNHLIK